MFDIFLNDRQPVGVKGDSEDSAVIGLIKGLILSIYNTMKLRLVPMILILSVCSICVGIDFNKIYFEQLELESMSLVQAVSRINEIHTSRNGGRPEFKILLEDPVNMDSEVSLSLNDVDLDLLLNVLLGGTGYHFVTAEQYIIIQNESNRFRKLAVSEPAQAGGSVCFIEIDSSSENDLRTQSWGNSGSGFLCEINGAKFLVTNIHVIAAANSISEISVRTRDNLKVELLDGYVAQDRDICIFRHKENADLEYLQLNSSVSSMEKNDPVYLLGYPLGGGVLRNAQGKLDGVGAKLIEVDVSAFRGNSGGPIIDSIGNHVVGVLTKAEIVSDDNFTELARAKLGNPISDDIRTFATRLDTIEKSAWEPLNWAIWKSEKEQIHFHVNALLALNSLVSSNYTPGRLITDEGYLVYDPDLWRAYKKCADEYSTALARKDSVLQNSALKSFIDFIEISFRPGGARWSELSRNWKYEWFVSTKSGNTDSWRLAENIKKLYREMHKDWSHLKRRWDFD